MKVLAVFVCSLAWSSAQYVYPVISYAPVHHYTTYTVPVHVSTQYHAQDTLGQFAFHHAGDNQVRTETKTVDGSVRGLYGYVDPTGKLVNVHYVADDNGFHVVGANNLPEAPSPLSGPEPVKDTPEVVAARAAFQKSYAEAAKAADASPDLEVQVSRRKRQAVLYPALYSLLTKSKVKVQELEPVEGAAVPADTKKAEIKEKEHEVYTHSVPVAYSSVVQPLVSPVVVNPAVVKAQDVVAVEAPTPADTKKVEIIDNPVVAYSAVVPSAVVPSAVSVLNQQLVSPVVHIPHAVYV